MTASFFLGLFNYYPELGVLVWKDHWDKAARTRYTGKVAGAKDAKGYRSVTVGDKKFKIHRIIWFLERGDWPEEIDHIDGDKLNNCIGNLRSANRRVNNSNRVTHRAGRLVGAYFHAKAQKWCAQITINGKNRYLGLHESELAAHDRYLKELKLTGGGEQGNVRDV